MFVNGKIQGLKRNFITTRPKQRNKITINLTYKRFAFYFGFFSSEMRNRGRETKVRQINTQILIVMISFVV